MTPAKIIQILPTNLETPYTDAEIDHLLEGIEEEITEEILEEMGEVTEEVLEEMEEEATEEILEIPVEVPYTNTETETNQMLNELEEEAAEETLEKVDNPEATRPEDPEAARVRDLWNTLRNPWNPLAQINLETMIQADVLACQEFMEQFTHLATRLGMLELLLGGGDRALHQSMINHLVMDYPAVANVIKGEGRPNQIWEEISANNIHQRTPK